MTISRQLFADNAKTTLSASVTATATTLPVVDASVFPTPTNEGEFFKVTLEASGVLEIVYVYGKSGNNLTGCIRAQEGKSPIAWPGGTRVENRTTARTLSNFVTLNDRLGEIASVDLLDPPIKSDGNSYICHSIEDAGNPIVAVRKSDYVWRFLSHPLLLVTSTVTSATAGTLTSPALAGFPTPVSGGRFIIQMVSGSAAGYCKVITAASGSQIQWGSAMAVIPKAGDTFQIYRSIASSIEDLAGASGDEGLIYSILLNE